MFFHLIVTSTRSTFQTNPSFAVPFEKRVMLLTFDLCLGKNDPLQQKCLLAFLMCHLRENFSYTPLF